MNHLESGVFYSSSSENEESDDDVSEMGQSSGSKRKQVMKSLGRITLRRQEFKEKMEDLADLIPNCDKTNSTTTIDDAMAYIRKIRYELQVKAMRSGFPLTSEQIFSDHFRTYLHKGNVPVRGSNGMLIMLPGGGMFCTAHHNNVLDPTTVINQECKENICCSKRRESIARATRNNQKSTSRPTTQPPRE